MPRPTRRKAVRSPRTHRHVGHSKAQCLKIFRRLSLYLDGELPDNACDEIRKHLHGCENCEIFLASFRRSVTLCQKFPAALLTPASKMAIRAAILKAAGAGSAQRR